MAKVSGATKPYFGISSELCGATLTQKFTISEKVDKKEARNASGDVKLVAFYNDSAEVTVEVLGPGTTTLLGEISLPTGVTKVVAGMIICEEISSDHSNEDFVKTSFKGKAHKLITTAPTLQT